VLCHTLRPALPDTRCALPPVTSSRPSAPSRLVHAGSACSSLAWVKSLCRYSILPETLPPGPTLRGFLTRYAGSNYSDSLRHRLRSLLRTAPSRRPRLPMPATLSPETLGAADQAALLRAGSLRTGLHQTGQ